MTYQNQKKNKKPPKPMMKKTLKTRSHSAMLNHTKPEAKRKVFVLKNVFMCFLSGHLFFRNLKQLKKY